MNVLIALIRREFWENRIALFFTPLVVGLLYVLGTLMAIFTTAHFDDNLYSFKDAIRAFGTVEEGTRSAVIYNANLVMGSLLFTLALGVVVFFYLLGSLYDDRKDKSILFWKSLPASDTMTMVSKLVTAMLVAPLIFWVIYVLTQILTGIIGAIMVMSVGENPWTLYLSLSQPIKAWFMVLASYLTHSVWALPLYGWLMLVSAFSPRIPLLFAILPPCIFAVLQLWLKFLQTFTFQDNLFGLFGTWFSNSPLILSANGASDGPIDLDVEASMGVPINQGFEHSVTLANMFDRLFSVQMFWGLVLGAAFLAAALWLRKRATES